MSSHARFLNSIGSYLVGRPAAQMASPTKVVSVHQFNLLVIWGDCFQVAEMEHHLLESSKEVKAITFERDMHVSWKIIFESGHSILQLKVVSRTAV